MNENDDFRPPVDPTQGDEFPEYIDYRAVDNAVWTFVVTYVAVLVALIAAGAAVRWLL